MTEKQITLASGLSIFVKTLGSPDLPPVILLHGWPSSHDLWRNIGPDLAGKFQVIIPDLPGHGASDKPRDTCYDLAFYRTFIQDLVSALGLKRFRLVAHDLGAMAALSYAVHHGDAIEKLVIMNTCPHGRASLRLNLTLLLLRQPLLSRFLLLPWVFKQILKTGIYNHDLLDRSLTEQFRAPWIRTPEARAAFSATIALPLSRMAEPRDRLNTITCPSLILWGKNDIFFPFFMAKRLHRDLPGSKLIGIDLAAHFCQEDNPGAVAKALTEFL